MNKILFNCPSKSIEEYKILAERAAKAGATHVFVTDLYKSRWQWEMNRNDPYPNWGMNVDTIFKIVVPDQLKEYIPADYAQKNLELIHQRAEVLKEYGLKAAFKGCEPGWLVPKAFEDHPDWRGPRFEHPRRALRPYFSPCIDHPEILEMYKQAMKQLCEIVPIEFFQLLTNDSGGGICWSQGLYPGKNGPLRCKHISFAQRITKFLSVLQEGAAQAGVTTEIKVRGSFPSSEIAATIPYLKEGQAIGARANGARAKTIMYSSGGETLDYFIGYFSDYYQNDVNPVMGIPQPIQFAQECREAFQNPESNKIVSFQSIEDTVNYAVFQKYLKNPQTTLLGQYQTLHSVAGDCFGERNADKVLEIWNHIYQFRNLINSVNAGGSLLMLGCSNQRWLTRPFVLKQQNLTEEEKAYYRPFLFQACGEKAAEDLMDLQSYRLVSGHSASYITNVILDRGLSELWEAVHICEELNRDGLNDETVEALRLLTKRLKVLICVVITAKHAIGIQRVIDETDFSEEKQEPAVWHVQSDERLLKAQEIILGEIDNVNELISLLQNEAIDKFLFVADKEENEDIFLMNPNLVEHLKKKRAIMMAHLMEANETYVRFN